LLLAAILAGQAATDALQPATSDTGAALGRAGFAYLTGVRTYLAAVLWNRLEPQFHEYYQGIPLQEQVQVLPTISLVTALDPEFIDSYYVAAWVLVRRDLVDEGLELAELGVENNPDSGVLRTSYAQLLHLHGNDLEAALVQADIALESANWRNAFEQHDNYAVLRSVYIAAGETAKAEYVNRQIERLDEILGDALPPGAHDHDGDGVPDH
jgi:hypothetical protein